MVTSYMVQQLISSVSPYTMSSVLTFVKVAGRGALAGPDGTRAGEAPTSGVLSSSSIDYTPGSPSEVLDGDLEDEKEGRRNGAKKK